MAKTEPCSGLKYGWSSSESWNTDMDNNLKQIGQQGIHPVVLSRAVTTPPVSPTLGDRYIIPSGATGAWAGRTNQVAVFLVGGWQFMQPKAGWLFYVADESGDAYYSGTAWSLPRKSTGTWTPTLLGGTTVGNPSYSSRAGFFVTDGPFMELSVSMVFSGTGHGMVGDLIITGFPAVMATGPIEWVGSGRAAGVTTSGSDAIFFVIGAGSTQMKLETRTPSRSFVQASSIGSGTVTLIAGITVLRDF